MPNEDDIQAQRTIGMIVGGAGVLAAIASGILTAIASSQNDESLEECRPDEPKQCTASGKAKRDAALNHAAVATVAGVVGGIAIAGGATLYFTAPYFNAPADEPGASLNLRGSW